jgi:hypothetical protein
MNLRRSCQSVAGNQHDDHLEGKRENGENASVPRRGDCHRGSIGSEPPSQQSANKSEQNREDEGIRHYILKDIDRDGCAAAQ